MLTTTTAVPESVEPVAIHPWLRPLRAFFLPGARSPVQEEVLDGLRQAFSRQGHMVQHVPDDSTDVLLATSPFGTALSWREAPFFQARRTYRLHAQPTVLTVVHARRAEWDSLLDHLENALKKEPVDPSDFSFPGLAPTAFRTLVEQGRRGGPVLAAERVLQAQAMCLRLLLVVGDEHPDFAYHFDLVGSLARSPGNGDVFYDDVVHRVATAMSADEVGAYTVMVEPIPRKRWLGLSTPAAMHRASLELDKRGFFTETVRIGTLVHVPAMSSAVASQYSEGCFSTWDPELGALISTITGSARPVDKGNITDDELAVIAGPREDRCGVYVRFVEGKRNDPPSSEAFEMTDIDQSLPWVTPDWVVTSERLPVVRSKLHGHRGVAAYDPRFVEFVAMEPAYSRYPVTCGTRAQAEGVKAAFERSEALRHPADPRQVVFTLLPTHGVFIVEKWVPGKVPFQSIWEHMDAGYLQIVSQVPQGPDVFEPARLA